MTIIGDILRFFDPRNLDNRGGLLIPFDLKLSDRDFYKYLHLKMNVFIDSIDVDDLPDEFSKKAVKLVDVFRRKTFDLDYEVMLVFDYTTAELIYCFVDDGGDGDEVTGVVDDDMLIGKNIAIIHNHPFEYGSPPSDENFQILSLPFEDYEILSSWDGIWILESKELIPKTVIDKIKEKIQDLNDFSCEISEKNSSEEEEIIRINDELYGNLLLKYINNLPLNIKLTKKVLK